MGWLDVFSERAVGVLEALGPFGSVLRQFAFFFGGSIKRGVVQVFDFRRYKFLSKSTLRKQGGDEEGDDQETGFVLSGPNSFCA